MSDPAAWRYLDWDESKVRRFWNFSANWEAWQDDYFSKQCGSGIVNFLRYVVNLQGRILDYGCGPGYLVEHLLASGISCEAADFSSESVQVVNAKFAGNPRWGGAKTLTDERLPYGDNTFDLIICIETIEHVLPDHTGQMLKELRRILKPRSGRLLMTTPNSEDMQRSQIYCPECSSVFHRWQHVSSFTPESLSTLLAYHRLVTVLCNVTKFSLFQQSLLPHPLDWSPRRLGTDIVLAMGRRTGYSSLTKSAARWTPFSATHG